MVFDDGEVIVDEAREYGTWADWLGIPRHTFSAAFGAAIARDGDYRDVFQLFQPGFDLATARQRRADADLAEAFDEEDLYGDVRTCLARPYRAGWSLTRDRLHSSRPVLLLACLDMSAQNKLSHAPMQSASHENPTFGIGSRRRQIVTDYGTWLVTLRPSQTTYLN